MSEPRRSARLAASAAATASTVAAEEPPAVETPATPALAPIDIGDRLPSYILKNEQGEDIDVAKLAEEKGVIIFSIPKADTPGCTTQACGFRDVYPNFAEHNFTVYCISHDKPEAQRKWQLKALVHHNTDREALAPLQEFPYTILSDPDRVLIAALGAKDASGKTKRGHFIFVKGGELVEKKLPVSPRDSPSLALEFVKSLSAKPEE